mmetsp:Transcript_42772/g.104391  ORF Transcript_42772/g.104391 Transcript_42772/m.104391 type:complete len:204 (+) Transcript_42772:141-752(+)
MSSSDSTRNCLIHVPQTRILAQSPLATALLLLQLLAILPPPPQAIRIIPPFASRSTRLRCRSVLSDDGACGAWGGGRGGIASFGGCGGVGFGAWLRRSYRERPSLESLIMSVTALTSILASAAFSIPLSSSLSAHFAFSSALILFSADSLSSISREISATRSLQASSLPAGSPHTDIDEGSTPKSGRSCWWRSFFSSASSLSL